jgi:hypothetical protein
MAVSTKLSFETIANLNLDPMNPQLGRHRMAKNTSQMKLIEWMTAWKIEELALSYLESGGFWSHEPLIVVEEPLYR